MTTLPDTQIHPDIRDTTVSSSAEAGRRVEEARQRLRGGAQDVPAVSTASGSAAEGEPPPMTAERAEETLTRSGFPLERTHRLRLLLNGLAIISKWYARDPTSRRRLRNRTFILADESLARSDPHKGKRLVDAVVVLATALSLDLATIDNPRPPIPMVRWPAVVKQLRDHFAWPDNLVPIDIVQAQQAEAERIAEQRQEQIRARERAIFDSLFSPMEEP